jgi:hypothetical protein
MYPKLLRFLIRLWASCNMPPAPRPQPPVASQSCVEQLSGHDTKFDKLSEPHWKHLIYSESPDSPSIYSQRARKPERCELRNRIPLQTDTEAVYVTPLLYSSNGLGSSQASIAPRVGDYSEATDNHLKTDQMVDVEYPLLRGLDNLVSKHKLDPAHPQDFEKSAVIHEHNASAYNQTKEYAHSEFVPAPLKLRPKQKMQESLKTDNAALFRYVRNDVSKGAVEVTASGRNPHSVPRLKKRAAIRISSMIPLNKELLKTMKSFLKNPIPTSLTRRKLPRSELKDMPRHFVRRVRPLGSRSFTKERIIRIQGGSRSVTKPPLSPHLGLMPFLSLAELGETIQVGAEQLGKTFSKAKHKLLIKISQNERRESLKKKITVIGPSGHFLCTPPF